MCARLTRTNRLMVLFCAGVVVGIALVLGGVVLGAGLITRGYF